MRGPSTHHEESHTSTVGIISLLVFFKKFFLPYAVPVCITTGLALCAIGADLMLPQLMRNALDRSITPAARMISLKTDSPAAAMLKAGEGDFLLPAGREGMFFIPPDRLLQMDRAAVHKLETGGMLMPEKFYAAPADAAALALAGKYPGLFYRAGTLLFIPYRELGRLEKQDLLRLRKKDLESLTGIGLAFIGILLVGFLFNATQIYVVERTSQLIMHDLRQSIFSHLQTRSMAFFTRNPVGRLVTRATNDVQNLHEMFSALFASIFKDIFMILGIMIILLVLNWRLALVCFALLPLLVAGAAVYSLASHSAFREVRIKIAAINARIQENLSGIAVVKAFCRELLNEHEFCTLNHENYVANMRQTVVFAIFTPLVDLVRVTAFALIIWYGGGQAIRETLSVGTLVIFIYYMRMFFTPIQDLAEKYNIVQSAFASLERIYLLFEERSMIADAEHPQVPAENTGALEFRNVSFGYTDQENVLHNVSFAVRPGETVAIVGITGAGKTTIINLLERFYDVREGAILLDAVDIRAMTQEYLRRQIGLVLQDVFLFAGTIRSNITLGRRDFSDEQIRRALEVANADRLVGKLPRGLDEDVHEGGRTLSAGERQLLSFARAVLIDPKILILDEATSNIDPVTEGLIQDAFEKIMQHRTCLVIAHRFSTIKKAGRIIVLHKGRIVEEGSHDELMAMGKIYKQLYELQYNI